MSSPNAPTEPAASTPDSQGLTKSDPLTSPGSEDLASRAEASHPNDDHAAFQSFATDTPPSWLGVLRHKHYRKILLGQCVSNIGTWAEFFTVQFFVAESAKRLDDQGWLTLCQTAPIAVFGILGGLAADRLNRRTLLVVTQFLAAIIAAGLAVVTTHTFEHPRSAVYWMFALGVLNGTVMAFNFPAWQVLTPRLVPKNELAKAITLNGIQFNATRILGPWIAGVLFASFGAGPALWANAASFALMAVVVMTTPDAPPPPKSKESVRDQIAEAGRFFWHNRGPRAVFIAQVLLSLLAAPLVRLLSNYVLDVYHIEGTDAKTAGSRLIVMQGIGAVSGGLALRLVPSWYPRHHFIPLAVTGLAITICAFAFTTTLWWGYAVMLVCGWFWIWAFNQSWAQLQVLTPDRLRGRAMSLANVFVFGATGLGAFVAGNAGEFVKKQEMLTAAHSTQGSILLLGIPLVAAGIVMMVKRVPEVDGMSRLPRKNLGWLNAITAAEHRPNRTKSPTVDQPESVFTGK